MSAWLARARKAIGEFLNTSRTVVYPPCGFFFVDKLAFDVGYLWVCVG